MLAAACAGIVGCRKALGTFFDVPPKARTAGDTVPRAAAATPQPAAPDTARPAIERLLDPDSVRALLPKDHAGNIDWMTALRRGVIRPRAALPGADAPPAPVFGFDFVFKGPDTLFDASFPHSSHTEWLACQQCHPRIVRYRNTPITMGDLFQGQYCGECHGKVSFPITTGCERCHRSLTMPAGRAGPELLGNVVMMRATSDASVAASDTIGNAAGVRTDDLPRATFPHWTHRIRYRCKACHMELFEPRAGANAVTMKEIAAGRACGRCHDGGTAFRAGFGECQRCHISRAPGAGDR